MRITSLTLEGFRSFGQQQTFKFPEAPGVYMITGSNEVDKHLGANGVGKTSFAEGLCWALYGKTSRGQKASAIGHWSGDYVTGAKVEFVAGDRHVIERRWNPNALLHQTANADEPKKVPQPVVDDAVGMDYDTFLAAVLFSQSGAHFMDLGATEQLAALCSALKLDEWQACAKRARDDAARLTEEIEANTRSDAALKAAVSESRKHWRRLKKLNATYVEQAREERALFVAKKGAARVGLKTATQNRVKARKLVTFQKSKLVDAEKALKKAEAAANAFEPEWLRATEEPCKSTVDPSMLRREYESAKRLIDAGSCSTCGQAITGKHGKKHLAGLKKRLDIRDVKYEKAKRKAAKAQAKLNALETEKRDYKAAAAKAKRKLGMAEFELEREELRLKYNVEEVKNATKALKEHDDRTNTLPDEIKTVTNELATYQARRKRLKKQAKALAQELGLARYWSAAFNKLRLWLIERALHELETNINNSLQTLGLEGWECTCSTSKELKSGDAKASLSITVATPDTAGVSVPWKSWSGGEAQRLRVAGAAAFADLVCSRMGAAPTLEIWDEPTRHLSQTGCEDLMQFFEERSRVLGKQLWVIDHRTTNSAGITATYCFRKTEQGTIFPKLP
jgi:DNA repair exonuclease SbcCD ATPase subunit